MVAHGRLPLAAVAALSALGLVATWLVAIHTSLGLRLDAHLYHDVSGSSVGDVQRAGQYALDTIDAGTLAVGMLVLAFLALARGRLRRALAAGAVVACSVGTTELLKYGGPHVPGYLSAGREPTFPSGHTAVAASLGLGLVIAVPPLLRGAAAVLGAAYSAGIAISVVALGWHEPSDAVMAFFICGTFAALAGLVLRAAPGRAALPPRALAPAAAVVAGGLAGGALLLARYPVSVESVRSRPALAATAAGFGFLAVVLFGLLASLVGEGDDLAASASAPEGPAGTRPGSAR